MINVNEKIRYYLILVMVSLYSVVLVSEGFLYFYFKYYIFLGVISLFMLVLLGLDEVKLKGNVYSLLFVFLLLASVSTVMSSNVLNAWGGFGARFTGLSTYLFCAILFVVASKVNSFDGILKVIFAVSGILSMVAIFQYYGFDIIGTELYRGSLRSYSVFGNPVFLANYVVFILPGLVVYYLHEKRVEWLIVLGLVFAALVMSMTRGAWLAFVVVFVIIVYYVWVNKSVRLYFVNVVLVLVIVSVIIFLTSSKDIVGRVMSVKDEVVEAVNLEDEAGSYRLELWKVTLGVVKNNWIFGIGADNLKVEFGDGKVENKAHNIFLELLVTMGVFSLSAYISFVWCCLKYRSRDWVGFMFFVMVLAYLLQGQFSLDVIMIMPLFWIVLGLMVSKQFRRAVVSC